MTDPIPNPGERLRLAVARSALFSGHDAVLGEAMPAIAMPMHLALDAESRPVLADGRNVFAKAFRQGALAPFTFADAAEASARAGEAGIAPRLLETDEANGVLLFEGAGAEWRMALARDVQAPDAKAAVLAAKKAWHGHKPLSRTLSPFDVGRDYRARLAPHLAADAPAPLPFKGLVPFVAIEQWIDRIEEALQAAGSGLGPIHGENTVSNILLGPDNRVLLVDFDRAVNADPLYDLGALCLDLCRGEDERIEAVEMYAGAPDEAVLARVKLYGVVDDFLWGCWALLAEINPGTNGPELFKYASNRFVRLSHHLQQFDLPHLLAKI